MKRWLLVIMLIFCLSACQNEPAVKSDKDDSQSDVIAIQANQVVDEYGWKTHYSYLIQSYIQFAGFLNIEENPFTEYNSGVAKAELLYSKERAIPYLAVLYASDSAYDLHAPAHQGIQRGNDVVQLDIWDFQDGELIRIYQQSHQHAGEAGDLAVAIVETEEGDTLLRQTSETQSSEFSGLQELFFEIGQFETPVYQLDHNNTSNEEASINDERFFVNDEVTKKEYEQKRNQLNYQETRWIESNIGAKSISDDIAPIVPNVLQTLQALNTDNVVAPDELLPIEEQAMIDKILRFELLEPNLLNEEIIEFANWHYMLPGGVFTEDGMAINYPKEAIDYYSESNFDFILDETTFAPKQVDDTPSYQNGVYTYSLWGDPPIMQHLYFLDVIGIEKLTDGRYKVEYEEAYFDEMLYDEVEGIDVNYDGYYLTKDKLPPAGEAYLSEHQLVNAVFQKNQYGYALVDQTFSPIKSNISLSKQKEIYMSSIEYAEAFFEALGTADDYKKMLYSTHDIWDDELNRIYGMLREKLPPEEMEQLKLEQRQWIKDRDAQAKTPEEVGVLTHWEVKLYLTKERTYDLIDLYFSK